MLDPEIRKRITRWKLRGAQENDPFIKFFIMYMCLDAWMTTGSGYDSDAKKLKWLQEADNSLKKYWPATPNKNVPLQGLKKIGKVEDMRPNNRGEFKYLTDTDDFKQVTEFIYQVRCNLFHGGKSYVNTNDRTLTRLSAKILQNWIEWTLVKTK